MALYQTLFLSDDLWPTVQKIAPSCSKRIAAVSYVTTLRWLPLEKGDVLICDASDHAIKSGQTSAAVLKEAFTQGVEIYSLDSLHAKVVILGSDVVIGSGNLSDSSANRLTEAALMTDQPQMLASAHSFVDQVKAKATRLDKKFVSRIVALPVTKAFYGSNIKRPAVQPTPARIWLVGTFDLDADKYPSEESATNTGYAVAENKRSNSSNEISWIRCSGTLRIREKAQVGDVVIQICSHSRKNKPFGVYKAAPITHRLDQDNWTRFYLEYPSTKVQEASKLTWAKFVALCKRAKLPSTISPESTRELTQAQANALFGLWT